MAMSGEVGTRLFGRDVTLAVSWPWAVYWIAFLRVLVGTVFLHAGMDKLLADQPFTAGWWLTGTASEGVLGTVMVWFGQNAPWFVDFVIPFGELFIGIGLIVGGLTRLASFFGATLMFFLYFGNADWEHGFVNGDLLLLVLFITLIIFGGGRIWGLDSYLEKTETVQKYPRLRYLLG
ncbi:MULTISPECIES: DoxX family protein [Haloferax]|uniref:DoxX family membrane protein n=2 Tax=Haloferax TaxID=2251 RepID=A0A6G1Z159_9EURY|nr:MULTISPECIES: DoxX family protein [Haloferax]KAB1187569.1 DoxX family protein [Haloferax sp. CBA1149]MRW80225.1 DoxX family membrane protein [Haloferax marinisediminis]